MTANDLVPQLSRIQPPIPRSSCAGRSLLGLLVFMKNARQLGMQQILMHGFGYVVPKYMQMAGDAAEGTVLVSLRFPVGRQLPDSGPDKEN